MDFHFAELNEGSSCRTYLVGSGGEALVVDPLLERVQAYAAALQQRGLKLRWAVDTHTHADHLSGARELVALCGGQTAGAPAACVQRALREDDELAVGALRVKVWATPGHTADSLCLVLPDRVLSGDTLLIATTGRTDLTSGDCEAEWTSLQRLLTLPDATLVFPGHDYAGRQQTTIGEERRTNPRVKAGHDAFIAEMCKPRPSKPQRLDEALAWNTRPL